MGPSSRVVAVILLQLKKFTPPTKVNTLKRVCNKLSTRQIIVQLQKRQKISFFFLVHCYDFMNTDTVFLQVIASGDYC